jgi:protease-4
MILFVASLAVLFWEPSRSGSHEPHTALIRLSGEISSESIASAERLTDALGQAFDDGNTKGVVIKINSPGGSPVQSAIVFDEMRRLRKAHPDVPLVVVCEEMCASAAYYIAAGADKIYVSQATLIGSIGVLMDGFGFEDTMKKLGVERRLLTAGENKGILDPFSPMSASHKAYVQTMLAEIHAQFIQAVKAGRGNRLKETPEVFSGLFYSGQTAVGMGLADDFGTVDSVARDVFKQAAIVDFSPSENVAEKLAKRFGASIGAGMFEAAMRRGSVWH